MFISMHKTLKTTYLKKTSFKRFHHLPTNLSPDQTYSPLLELCVRNRALSQCQQAHAHMITSNVLHNSVFLNTKLVFIYGKCGSLWDAHRLFDQMPQRTIFTWNAMIGACVSNREFLLALELYRDMRGIGVLFDAFSFPALIKACGAMEVVCNYSGSEIHGFLIKCGFGSVVFIGNALVAMYAKFEDLGKARRVFDDIGGNVDVVSWNSIVSAYAASKRGVEALQIFREMQKVGVGTDTYGYVAALQACNNSLFGNPGREIHAVVLKSNDDLSVHIVNSLIAMYVSCGRLGDSVRVFEKFDKRDCISWNALLSGFVQHGLYGEALAFFHDMQNARQKPDKVSLMSVLSACGRLGKLLNGMEVHAHAIRMGLELDLQVGNTLLDLYSKCSCMKNMWQTFSKMPDKDIITWTTVIAGFAQNDSLDKAIELFQKSQTQRITIDTMMMSSALQACGGLKCLKQVKQFHGLAVRRGLSDLMLQNKIVNAYGECDEVDYATRIFNSIESKDVVTWTSMLCCYVNNGLANEALQLFQTMNSSSIQADSIALVSALSAIASLSLLNRGKEIHGYFIRKGFVSEGSLPSSLVDMYARCGTLENANKVFNGVKDKDLVLWTNIINANGLHGRGKAAIDLFFEMENKYIFPDHITFLALLYACSHSGLVSEGKFCIELMKSKYQLEPWPEHYACMVDLLGRTSRLDEAYNYVLDMDSEPTTEVWCALLRSCQVHSNKKLGQVVAEKLLESNPKSPGNYVLVSNVFAASGRWKDVERVRTQMKISGVKKNPGCSWIEEGNMVHTFMASDKSHPQSEEIYQKLAEVTKKLIRDGGYVAQTKMICHDVEDEVKVQMLYEHSERLAIAYGLLKTSVGTPIRISKNLRVCSDCHNFCNLVSKLFQRELVVRDANRFHHFKSGKCSCGDFWNVEQFACMGPSMPIMVPRKDSDWGILRVSDSY